MPSLAFTWPLLVISLILAIWLARRGSMELSALSCGAVIMTAGLLLLTGIDMGTGTLALKRHPLTEVLQEGRTYEFVSSAALPAREGLDGWPHFHEEVLIIKEEGEVNRFLAARVEKGVTVPERFVIHEGMPVALP